AAVDPRVAGDGLAHVAVLVLVVVDAHPRPAGVVGAEDTGDAVDRGDRVQSGVGGAGGGLAVPDVDRLGDGGQLGEGGAAVGGAVDAGVTGQPDVPFVSRHGLEPRRAGQAGRGGGEGLAAVGADVEG